MNIPPHILFKVMTKTPGVFLNVARESMRCLKTRMVDYPLGKVEAAPPRYVDIKLTNRCNLRCAMCGQWGKEGTFREACPEVLREEMDLPLLKSIVDEVRDFKPMFYLWGGEPFLYADLVPFLQYLDEAGLIAASNTNGTLLEKTAEDLVGGSLANILISIDGPREVHDRVRGLEGTFDRVMNGVDKLMQAKDATGSALPYVTFVATVNKENQTTFPEVYDIAEEVGVDFVGLQFGTFTTVETGEAYEKRMKECLDCHEARSWKGFLSYDTDLDYEAIQEGVRKVRNTKHSFGKYFWPDLQPEDIPQYYTSTEPVKGRCKCVVPWMRVDLLPNGDVYPCIDFPDYIVGNVHDTPLMELWNGEKYVKFRKELQEGLLPICGRCTTLYEF